MNKDKTLIVLKKAINKKKVWIKLKSPIWRVWWKSKLSKEIVSLFPEHKHYIEVFGWWLSIFFTKQKSQIETINDINSDLINFWEVIKNHPQTLSYYLNQMFISREIFNKIKTGKYIPSNKIERWAYFYYLITQSFWSRWHNFAMSSKAGRKPKNIYKNFQKWAERFKLVTIENMSFDELIKKYNNSSDTFFYLDPPYFNFEKVYKAEFKKEQHILLRDLLKNIKGKFLLSYNDCKEIRNLYKDFYIKSSKEINYTLWRNNNWETKKVKELYISNYKI